MTMIVGNDISSYQGNPDFDTLKKNANFVIVKATEGIDYTSPNFVRAQTEARRVGLLLGYYHFGRPSQGNTPQEEAAYFLRTIGQLAEGEILALDYEDDWNGNVVWWCYAFLNYVYQHTGVKPLIYLNQSQVLNKAYNWRPIVDAGYGLWLAWYNQQDPVTTPWAFEAMQQWTNKELVPGISGSVDGDYFYGTSDQFKAYGYHRPVQPPGPVPPVHSPSSSTSGSPSASDSSSTSPSASESPSASPSASPSPSEAPSFPAAILPQLHDVIYSKWSWFGENGWINRLHQLKKILETNG